ncbi:MAG: glutamine--fructose-6-phosphate aminotransferase [Candidatus Raymondbacteria bacterium RifOxyA12_full_50_37]|uniref:Glutamine--fructose-6-phosphate aminotransferase [isomerizing] n=1 Tax=Candidatus Raymondbacteria bacterium RIFOXYD12_FULL_49_13 TaxID=1817890 RepID=A0A1F7F3N7_UNCRA|nr:MAG: glutamine--fructose-6-phosphate aminotransferase [Candidatus Raymondbacteria bacterium RifOxyA12_full_50_37]OGJ86713.1 MAG: glutamine--fructose-6-phosphate aminotransferase [Candidatus Raymondbacteria bacterium RifOxyB12_full_50_8]OGJ88387.1 MAG: glutamine--fructose-6-phosphate aminotransferase [Candidatus Raymondbacteria bacterium RIFOXYA2_FULL_49_16]OGJ96225.1 MAG: glutamine--fructose-6-phosphate aminotransferase [Candidatus Raymondbacteria bacterium RIFOXYC2_FULL_50_21]OGK01218.1 MAG
MCGIVGYIGKRPAVPIIVNGIAKLDYRGYDSAGFAISENNRFVSFKTKGKLENLRKRIHGLSFSGTRGIAHTRWATHGKPSEKNAHPHFSHKKDIVVVHNGIIENHTALRKYLESKGHHFSSETDTETIPHLIGMFYQGNLENAVVAALKDLQGTYGLAIMAEKENKIVVARKGSPIIIGIIRTGEYIVASDVTAIGEYTKKIVYLSDGDIAVLTPKGYQIFNLEKKEVNRKIENITWSLDAIEKKGFAHFMLKEIYEQPETLANALRGKWDARRMMPKFGGLNIPEYDINNLQRVIILACGTSWHAGLVAEYYLEKFAGFQVEVEYASEFLCKMDDLGSRDLVIPISQSGETIDTLMALRKANKFGVYSLGIVNSVGSTIAREVTGGSYIHVGLEIGVASTKAFTGQIMALYLLAIYLGRVRGILKGAQADILFKKARALPGLVTEIFKNERTIISIARKFKRAANFIYLGRGLNYPTALEGALKLKEISYIHAEAFPAAEMKHGPIALVDRKMPVVFTVQKDDGYEKILSNIEEIRARKGIIIAVVEKGDSLVRKKADYIIEVPGTSMFLSPMLNIVPLQLLAYHIARLRGCEIDKPRNLAKSVTVE